MLTITDTDGIAAPSETAATPNSRRRTIVASVVGNALEWYDFIIYGTASALVFGDLFFAATANRELSTLIAFGGYGVGFLARPLGGIVFGHIGDRIGRRTAMIWTLCIMGLATFAIGLLPTYAQAGPLAPVLLISLRLVQGLAAGGEWGGGVLLVTESTGRDRRGYIGAWSQAGIGIGFLLSSLVFWLAQQLPREQFLAYGWRLPFLVSIFIFGFGLYLRRALTETPGFTVAARKNRVADLPVLKVLREHPHNVLVGVGARLAEVAGSNFLCVFSLAYGAAVGVSTNVLMLGLSLSMLVDSGMMLVFGALSDRIGRRKVYIAGAAALGLFAYPFLLLLGSGSAVLVVLAMVIGNGLCHAAMIGVQPALFTEMFPAEVRYSALSLAHEVSSVIVAFGPMIGAGLYLHYKSPLPVALFIVVLSIITIVSVAFAREIQEND